MTEPPADDITIEMFFVDGPLPGFGAVEITEPE
jgi:hypothetical protein